MRNTLTIQAEVEAFLRDKLGERLANLSPEQAELFHRRNPPPLPEGKLIDAIDLCDRAIRKNERDGRYAVPAAV